MRSKLLVSLGALLCCLSPGRTQTTVPTSSPSVVKLESGVIYRRGDYGLTEATTVLVVPLTFSYEYGSWVSRASLPWLTIDGPANVIGDSAGAGGPVRPVTGSESGLGDSSLSLTYKFNPVADRLNIDLTGRVKLPTGDDERGIGTGEIDTYAQLDLYRSFGTATPFGSVGFRWLGDGRYELEDGLYASGGLLFTVAQGTSAGVSYEWREALVLGGDNAREGSIFLFQRFDHRWSGYFSAMKGFTDASADHGFGTQVSYTF